MTHSARTITNIHNVQHILHTFSTKHMYLGLEKAWYLMDSINTFFLNVYQVCNHALSLWQCGWTCRFIWPQDPQTRKRNLLPCASQRGTSTSHVQWTQEHPICNWRLVHQCMQWVGLHIQKQNIKAILYSALTFPSRNKQNLPLKSSSLSDAFYCLKMEYVPSPQPSTPSNITPYDGL